MAGIQTSQITTATDGDLSLNPAGTGNVVLPDLAGSGEVPMGVDTDGNIKPLDEREFDQLTAVDPGDKIMVQRGTGYYYVDATDLGGLGLADPNPPTDIEWLPADPPGTGTKTDPYVLTPATVNAPGGSATSVESCRIINQKPDTLVVINEIGGQVGSRMDQPAQICSNDGNTQHFNFGYLDNPNTVVGTNYDGLMRIGNSSIYVKWVVTQVANKTFFGPEGGAPNASPQTVSYPFDSKYGKGTGVWADGSKTLYSTGDLVFGVNGGGLSTSNKNVVDGDVVEIGYVEATVASAAEGTTISGNLVSTDDQYLSIHSIVKDVTPIPFSIPALNDAPIGSQVTTGNNPLKGVNAPTSISLTSSTLTDVELSVAGAAWSSGPWTFNPGDSLQARATTGPDADTAYNAVFNVGGISVTWSVTNGSSAGPGPGAGEIKQPFIISPSNGSSSHESEVELRSDQYVNLGSAGPHTESDWEVYKRDDYKPVIGPISSVETSAGTYYTGMTEVKVDGSSWLPHTDYALACKAYDGDTNTYAGAVVPGARGFVAKTTFNPPIPITSGFTYTFIDSNGPQNVLVNGKPGDGPGNHNVGIGDSLETLQWGYKPGENTHHYRLLTSVTVNGVMLVDPQAFELTMSGNPSLEGLEVGDTVKEVAFNGAELDAESEIVALTAPNESPTVVSVKLSTTQGEWSVGSYVEGPRTISAAPPSTEPPAVEYTLVDSSYNNTTDLTSYTPDKDHIPYKSTFFCRVKYRDNGSSESDWSYWSSFSTIKTTPHKDNTRGAYKPYYRDNHDSNVNDQDAFNGIFVTQGAYEGNVSEQGQMTIGTGTLYALTSIMRFEKGIPERHPCRAGYGGVGYLDGYFYFSPSVKIHTDPEPSYNLQRSVNGGAWEDASNRGAGAAKLVGGNGVLMCCKKGYLDFPGRSIVRYTPSTDTWDDLPDPGGLVGNVVYERGMWMTPHGMWSTDNGDTWNPPTTGPSGDMGHIAYGNGIWVSIPELHEGVAVSSDGLNWTQTDIPGWPTYRATGHEDTLRITFGGGYFIAGTRNNLQISQDGINWEVFADSWAQQNPAYTNGVWSFAHKWGIHYIPLV